MKSKVYLPCRIPKWNLLSLLFTGSLLLNSSISAQDDEEDDIFLMSPFVVETTENIGYLASSTLAGTRIRTDLDDIATSISVVTPEFLQDTGSTNLRDLLIYTTGTEVAGMGGNFTNFTLRNNNVTDDTTVITNQSNRVRGLASADIARNYFNSLVRFDSYNTSRVEINRGSNAVLFGLGSPAGIINNATQDADFGDSRRIDLHIGSFDSYRASFNFNQELIENELAVRVASLKDYEGFEQDYAFSDWERVYVAAKFSKDLIGEDDKMVGNTTIRANFESGENESNNPRIIPPVDLVTPWFTPYTDDVLGTVDVPAKRSWDAVLGGQAGSGRTDSWNVRTVTDPSDPLLDNGRLGFFVVDGFRFTPGMVFEGEDHLLPGDAAGESLLGRQGNVLFILRDRVGTTPFRGWGHAAMMVPTNLQTSLGQWRGTTDNPGSIDYSTFFFNPVVEDRSIFDYRNQSLDGPNKREYIDFEVANINIEQLFWNDKAGIEFAWANETVDSGYDRLVENNRRRGLMIDLNVNLMDGTPNKNYGRPFYASNPRYNRTTVDTEVSRFTGFVDLDFRENDGITKWLGRHLITGLTSEFKQNSRSIGGPLSGWDPFSGIYGRERNFNNFLASDEGRVVSSIHYLGPSLADRTEAAGSNIPQTRVNQLPMSDKNIPGGLFRVHTNERDGTVNVNGTDVFTAPGFRDVALTQTDYPVGSASISESIFETQALVLQSYLLNDNIVGTFSWRKDEFDTRTRGNPERTPFGDFDVDPLRYNTGLIPDSDALIGEEETTTWGIVAKVPQAWLENIGAVSTLNFHYGESSNFQPSGLRTNTSGEIIDNPGGETTDYGFTLGLMENKLYVRVTWYETSQVNVSSSGAPNFLAAEVVDRYVALYNVAVSGSGDAFTGVDGLNILADTNGDGVSDATLGAPAQELLDLQGFSINSAGVATYNAVTTFASINDVTSEGMELEIVFNPTENWRILFNASRQEAVQTGLGIDLTEFLTVRPLYDLNGDGTPDTSISEAYTGQYANITADQGGDPTGITHAEMWNNFWAPSLSRLTVFEGTPTPEVREWRWNLVSNYAFTEGPLAGYNFGGSVRWEEAAPIGYELGQNPLTGASISDLSKPILGEDTLLVDAWVGYRRALLDGKVDWNIQLNVRNLLNDDDLIPVAANPDGRVAAYRIPSPLVWELRNTFSF